MKKHLVLPAIEAAGNMSKLARLIGVTPQTVQKWNERGRVPAERVLQVERATGIARHKLRPDLYPSDEAA